MKETVGAMELNEDYYTHWDSCHTHAHTHISSTMCVCVCREHKHAALVDVMRCNKWDNILEKCHQCGQFWGCFFLFFFLIHTFTIVPQPTHMHTH